MKTLIGDWYFVGIVQSYGDCCAEVEAAHRDQKQPFRKEIDQDWLSWWCDESQIVISVTNGDIFGDTYEVDGNQKQDGDGDCCVEEEGVLRIQKQPFREVIHRIVLYQWFDKSQILFVIKQLLL